MQSDKRASELVRSLEEACSSHGPRIALQGDDTNLSYAALWAAASERAEKLRASGVGPGDPVMVKCSNHPSDFAAILAVWLAGGVAAPVHRSSPPDVLAAIQGKAQCRASVDFLSPMPVQMLDVERPDDARSRVLKNGALVIFTSGSTGLPKGVVLSHQALYGKLLQNCSLFAPDTGTVSLLVLNNTFSFGIWVVLMTLMRGGKVVAHSKFTPQSFLRALVDEGVSFLGVVPTMIRATFGSLSADALAAAQRDIASAGTLERVVIGGEPLGQALSVELRRFIAPALLYDVYGLTETSTSDFVLDPKDYPANAASIGKPAHGIRFRIVDDTGYECAPSVVGELQLQTPYIMNGYLGDEELTRKAFTDGWFRTGDLATRSEDGFVTVVGRLKEMIIRGGNKVTPIEVERALLRCSGVANAMVTGMPDPILGQRIHALIVPKPDVCVSLAALQAELACGLEKFKAPDAYYLGQDLPVGRTGKIDRAQLQKLLAAGALQPLQS